MYFLNYLLTCLVFKVVNCAFFLTNKFFIFKFSINLNKFHKEGFKRKTKYSLEGMNKNVRNLSIFTCLSKN